MCVLQEAGNNELELPKLAQFRKKAKEIWRDWECVKGNIRWGMIWNTR